RILSSPAAVVARSRFCVTVQLSNRTSFDWKSSGTHPIRLSYHWSLPDGSLVVWDGLRTPLFPSLAAGRSGTFDLLVEAPELKGTYLLTVVPVQEHVRWLGATPEASQTLAVEVERV